MKVFIDDVIRKLIEIKSDGYSYCDIDFIPEDEYDGEKYPAWVSFEAVGFGGDENIDYNGDDESEVCEVPEEELEEYAFQNRKPSPSRRQIKNITISD